MDWVIGAGGTEYSGLKFNPLELLKIGYKRENIAKKDNRGLSNAI